MKARLALFLFLYKLACLLVGFSCVYMGYRLFENGALSPASLEAAKGDVTVKLLNAAPGTFFALFGALVVAVVVWRGLEFSHSMESQEASLRERAAPLKAELNRLAAKVHNLQKDGALSADVLLDLNYHFAGIAASFFELTGERVPESESGDSWYNEKPRKGEEFAGFASHPGG